MKQQCFDVEGTEGQPMPSPDQPDVHNFVQQGAAMSWGDENSNFVVVVNDEEQYSIWPDYKAIPAGWREAGKSGRKDECLQWIDEVWTDMRPLSLRKAMAESAAADRVTNS
ncbi:MbtH protein [Burkholderia sp. OAS925]|nr:MbtH protein [Paraburkholderia graminis]